VACATPREPLTDSTSALNSAPLIQLPQPEAQPVDDAQQPDNSSTVTTESNSSPSDITIVEDYRESFVHGDKGPAYQKYIVLHDTESNAGPASVIDWWDSNGNLVAAHFVIGTDGTVYQCVPLDKIAHHAGYGDAGHNAAFEITEDGRDDMAGSTWIGDWAPDYGMNAWSVGIELVHVGGSGSYPEEQLNALDSLIAYIDTYFGFESTITDHKAWRSGNSDTSPEFAEYLYSYQDHRRHNP
jgi:N-acetyl-anhydromuramyl-L-alanine amidase AmpD